MPPYIGSAHVGSGRLQQAHLVGASLGRAPAMPFTLARSRLSRPSPTGAPMLVHLLGAAPVTHPIESRRLRLRSSLTCAASNFISREGTLPCLCTSAIPSSSPTISHWKTFSVSHGLGPLQRLLTSARRCLFQSSPNGAPSVYTNWEAPCHASLHRQCPHRKRPTQLVRLSRGTPPTPPSIGWHTPRPVPAQPESASLRRGPCHASLHRYAFAASGYILPAHLVGSSPGRGPCRDSLHRHAHATSGRLQPAHSCWRISCKYPCHVFDVSTPTQPSVISYLRTRFVRLPRGAPSYLPLSVTPTSLPVISYWRT